jgi:signal transduction histidine kinase/ActR/RegA family two-component response regulator
MRLGTFTPRSGALAARIASTFRRTLGPVRALAAMTRERDALFAKSRTAGTEYATLLARYEDLAAEHAEVAARNAELTRASRMKSSFLASMSHELRTPLNAILGFSDLLLSGDYGPLDSKQKPVVQEVRAAGHQLLTVINEVLDLSKIEAGRIEVRALRVDVAEPVEQACSLVASTASNRSIRIVNEVQEGETFATADPDRLRQVLINLTSNAVKFTPDGGMVTIEASAVSGRVRVAVTDTGIGIAKSDADNLFFPFSQLDSGHARRFQGTGLGLSICKSLVELMGGTIGFTSEPGQGSTFFFTLPAAEPRRVLTPLYVPAVRQSEPPVSFRAGGPSLLRVLLVDDSEVNRKVIRAMLQRTACEVIEAGDAATGLRVAREQAPAAILMDIEMPEMDGLTATARLKADEATSAIPVIAVTAHAMAGDADRALAAGCLAYVSKPISRARLYEALDLALGSAEWRGVRNPQERE